MLVVNGVSIEEYIRSNFSQHGAAAAAIDRVEFCWRVSKGVRDRYRREGRLLLDYSEILDTRHHQEMNAWLWQETNRIHIHRKGRGGHDE